MKVLKPGRWLFKFTCKNCEAFLEGEEKDLYTYQMGQTLTVGCNCASCGHRHKMDNAELPPEVLSRIHNPVRTK